MLKIKNWDAFQHYKDRDPPWIKLHRGLLEDYTFFALPDVTKAHVIMIWLLAARCGNRIPEDASWIGSRIGAKEPVDLETIIAAGFLVQADTDKEPDRAEGWGSRYISAELREEVLRVKGHKCLQCSSPENIELDHVKPVSKGGQSTLENLQPLCRSCNRSKRAKEGHLQKKPAEQVATQIGEPAYPRGREETEGETEEEEKDPPRRSEPSAGEPIAEFEFKCDGRQKTWFLTQEYLVELEAAFPHLNVLAETRKALAWTRVNPEKQKTARGMPAFLFRWLGKAQNDASRSSPKRPERPSSPLGPSVVAELEKWKRIDQAGGNT